MKYDTIIIGGGLSGLVAGVALAEKKQKVAIVSLGQSALHFSSGSFGLLGNVGGKQIDAPLEAIAELPAAHPYSRLGADTVKDLSGKVVPFFAEAGITLKGDCSKNSVRITPMGKCKSCWLTLDEFATVGDLKKYKKAVIISISSFLDFYPDFLATGIKDLGLEVSIAQVSTPEIDRLRRSTAEMRATSIGRQLRGNAVAELADAIKKVSAGADVVLMPAVAGFDSEEPVKELRRLVGTPLFCIATTPMSMAGTRMQMQLRRRFEALGGTYMLGDNVVAGKIGEDGTVEYVDTANLTEDHLYAQSFILASGGFFGHGIVAEPHRIYEPVFGFEVMTDGDRDKWFDRNFFATQPYMSFGLDTDETFHPLREGKAVKNLYAAGAVLGGYDALKEESGAGVAILTALHVADLIAKK